MLGAGEPKGGPGPGSGGGAGTGAGAGSPGTGHLPQGRGGPGRRRHVLGSPALRGSQGRGRRSCSRRRSHCVPDVSHVLAGLQGDLPVPPYPAAQSQPKPWRRPWRRQRRRPRQLREVAAAKPWTAPSRPRAEAWSQRSAAPARALSHGPLDEDESADEALPPRWPRWPRRPRRPARKGSYVSAFRPVVKDAESIAKLYGSAREAYGGGQPWAGAGRRDRRRLREPGLSERGSSGYHSASPDVDTADEPGWTWSPTASPTTRAPRTRPSPVRPAPRRQPNGDQPAGPPSITSSGADGPTNSQKAAALVPGTFGATPSQSSPFGDLAADDMVRKRQRRAAKRRL